MVRFPAAVLAVACCATLMAGDVKQLEKLEAKHRTFELRDLLDAPGWKPAETLFYRAIVNSRFGHEREGAVQFREFLAGKPAREMEIRARAELSTALARMGDIGAATGELAAALRLMPEGDPARADLENARALMASLSDVPARAVEFGPPAPVQAERNELGLWTVPVEVNGQRGEWILDTGASLSVVSESEARRLGLAVREVRAYAVGSTQARNAARLAVAPEVRLGSARIYNVAFLVLADAALLMSKHQIQGILGLPVMRALGCVDLSAQGALTFDCGAGPAQGRANFFFDGLAPIVQVLHNGHTLQMFLDTGRSPGVFYPSLRDTLAQWERYQLNGPGSTRLSGAGGSVQLQTITVPSIQMEILGRTLYLQGLKLLSQPPPDAAFRDGVLGIDGLTGGFRLDFRAMQFSLK